MQLLLLMTYLAAQPLQWEDAMVSIEDLQPRMVLASVQKQHQLFLIYGEFVDRPVIRFAQYNGTTGQVRFFDDPSLGNLLGTQLLPWGEQILLLYLKNGVLPKAHVISAQHQMVATHHLGTWPGWQDNYAPQFATSAEDAIYMTVKTLEMDQTKATRFILLKFDLAAQSITVLHQKEGPKSPLFWLNETSGFFEVYPFSGAIHHLDAGFERTKTLKRAGVLMPKDGVQPAVVGQTFRDDLANYPFKYYNYFDFPFFLEESYTFRGFYPTDDDVGHAYGTLSREGSFEAHSSGQPLARFKDHQIVYDFEVRAFVKVSF